MIKTGETMLEVVVTEVLIREVTLYGNNPGLQFYKRASQDFYFNGEW
jgi:hypothetical protein